MTKGFALVAPTPPRELRRPVAHEEAMTKAVRDAMRAALAGKFTLLNELEIQFLNLLVRIGELVVRYQDGVAHAWFTSAGERNAPFVLELQRGCGPAAETVLVWGLMEKCRRCDGKLLRRDCRVCAGRWYVDDMDDHEILRTSLEGMLLEVAA